ncbi:tetratricopeptide repeat protein [Paenibacillus thalictri]|uniref:Sel1 repeat family protein n=1 Tax=Paenibacillus thalictri TaxID=2527873 RepID=A0A4V2J4C4_9BACL|nr:SEL1-like repeat protein [Paenibacillus thalictri]TBL79092.1 hypothetical protein EYB31_12800 [Paenibacillus thalictri]
MNIVTMEDINYLAQQSSGRINMILSGMTALMNDTDNKVTTMESQGWFQRMVKTVTGKNKFTLAEIRQNHDKLNAYMSEAIAELYNRNCIDHEIMLSLGTQLNELYADHLQLKQMLGAFVRKLNEKIDSVDSFHMLTREIDQGVYSVYSPLVAICKVISQFDKRILEDNRKLDILKRSLILQNIINNEEILLTDYLMSIVDVPIDEMGQIYMELGTIRGNFMSNLILGMVEKYHFLPDMARKMKNKKSLIEEIISEEKLDDSIALSISEIYDDFVNSKIDVKNGLIPIAEVQIDSKLEEAEKLYFDCILDEAFELFKTLAEKGNARAMYFMGEYYVQPYGHVARDIEEGKKWRQRGHELGDTLSSINVAYSLPKDSQERNEIFNKMLEPTLRLAESGDIFAQNELADLYISGYGTTQNTEEGLKWLRKSAEAGFWRSIDKLGDAYYNGTLVEQDYTQAMEYYEKGVQIGYARSELNLAYCYYYGKGTDEDNSRALELFKKAYDHGSGEAASMVGFMYYKGYGVSADNEQEFIWMKRSAESGYALGQSNLANCYASGRGTAQDHTLAKQWYIKAAKGGNDYAATEVGKMEMDNNNYAEAVKWYRKAAENGYADAQNRLGVRYTNGQGVEKDDYEAFRWYVKAAEQGHMKAQGNVGYCYHSGDGVSADDDKAKEWLRKSAEQGNDDAINWLSKWYGEGSGSASSSSTSSSSGTITKSTLESIKTSCEVFVMMHDESKYDVSYKLKQTLNIEHCDEIYLAHDDTLFKSGKNGFAITSDGIYCREMMSSYTNHVSFYELNNASNIYWRDSNVYADGNVLAYYTGSNSDKDDLVSIFEKIKMFVRIDLF